MSALMKMDQDAVVERAGETWRSASRLQILERNVFGLLGIPIDVVDMEQVIQGLEGAKINKVPFVLSTPNLNFLIQSRGDRRFREALLASDICPADGMPIVWLSKVIGIPLKKRIPGSDIFDALKERKVTSPMRVFFFGGAEGVGETVARRMNEHCLGMKCVGSISPGYGTVEQMSSRAFLDQINASGADFIAIFLSAKKGQDWLMKNADALRVAIRAQLGATINFQAGTVRRAPTILRSVGLEWVWRIKEEPFLWRRYLRDGLTLLWIGLSVLLPIFVRRMWLRDDGTSPIRISSLGEGPGKVLQIAGSATLPNIAVLQDRFSEVLNGASDLTVDLSETTGVDARFFGLLLVVRKILNEESRKLHLVNASASIRRLFRLHGFDYLFADHP